MTRTSKRAVPHIAMRIGSYQGRGLGKDVIESHNDVADRHGKVLFGKAGRNLSGDKLQMVRDAMTEGGDSCLIVIRRFKKTYQCYKALILSLPVESFQPDLRFVPEYYHDLAHEIGLWVEVDRFTAADDKFLRSLELVSNSRSLMEILDSCRTSLMLVRKEANK